MNIVGSHFFHALGFIRRSKISFHQRGIFVFRRDSISQCQCDSSACKPSWICSNTSCYRSTSISVYIYIYIYICVCVCVLWPEICCIFSTRRLRGELSGSVPQVPPSARGTLKYTEKPLARFTIFYSRFCLTSVSNILQIFAFSHFLSQVLQWLLWEH